ncbi:hypothetical protein EDD18DRAFT_1346807 [Armillaria luteobubalina]|uniref:Uncharacterized protein n=1 Tax=Armillaria luteobubalina TaxID=153913 RepID=A0AA39QI11_9AGAR|nr:hypothetical protein EDD18DRAFT_1346807 [Armillaria luteobubalina]
MLQYIENNDYLHRLHKKKGISACHVYHHEPIGYPIVAASYNHSSAGTKFIEWVNNNGQFELTNLESPSPTAKALKVNMAILFDPSTLKIPGYIVIPKSEAIQHHQDKQSKVLFKEDELDDFLDLNGDEGLLQFIGGSPKGHIDDNIDTEGDPGDGEVEDGNSNAAMVPCLKKRMVTVM